MPALNPGPFLCDALESVLAQTTVAPWELLVIDDGCTDATPQVLASFRARFGERLRVLRHPHGVNRGTSASRNLGLAQARGEVIAMLDADDVWQPHMLEQQLALLQSHPEAAMVYAQAERTWQMDLPCATESSGPHGVNELPPLLPAGCHAGLLTPPAALTWCLADETLVPCTCTVLVRTAVAHEVGGFEDSFQGLYDDQAFYAKVMLRYPVAVSAACVARYRRHYGSCCAQTWHNAVLQKEAKLRFRQWLGIHAAQESTPEALTAAD